MCTPRNLVLLTLSTVAPLMVRGAYRECTLLKSTTISFVFSTFRERLLSLHHLNADLDLIRYSQKQKFQEERKMLQQGKMHVRKDSCIFRLDPYLEDGVLRVGGRLSRSAMPEKSKHPIILHKDLRICSLILEHIHQRRWSFGSKQCPGKVKTEILASTSKFCS